MFFYFPTLQRQSSYILFGFLIDLWLQEEEKEEEEEAELLESYE